MSQYKFVEGQDFVFGEGGDIPPTKKTGRYMRICERLKPGQWVQVKSAKMAQSLQYSMRRMGMKTKKRQVEHGMIRVYALSKEQADALPKRGTKEKILHTRKRRKDKQGDSQQVGVGDGQEEAPRPQEEETQVADEPVAEQPLDQMPESQL